MPRRATRAPRLWAASRYRGSAGDEDPQNTQTARRLTSATYPILGGRPVNGRFRAAGISLNRETHGSCREDELFHPSWPGQQHMDSHEKDERVHCVERIA
jgi:hypothetical protein